MFTDEQLMQQYVDGDERAFSRLYIRYRPIVLRVVKRHVFRAADVEDLVQQTFTQLHASRTHYSLGEPLRPWLELEAVRTGRQRSHHALADALVDLDQPGTRNAPDKHPPATVSSICCSALLVALRAAS